MTITYLGESNESGSSTAQNSKGKRSYTRKFRLETDDKTDRAYDIGSHASLPVIGSVHPEDANAYCTDISVTNSNPWKGWTVTATYSDERTLQQSSSGNGPEDDEVLISWQSEGYEEVVTTDTVTGKAILNSAGDPYDEPPTRESTHLVASIQANFLSVPAWILSYQNAVNSDAITIGGLAIAAGLAKMSNLSIGNRQIRNGTNYYPVSFDIKIKKDGWKFEPLESGYRQRKSPLPLPGSDEKVDCLGADKKVVSEPVPLDAFGIQLDIGDPSTTTFAYGDFTIYPQLAFAGNLPGVT